MFKTNLNFANLCLYNELDEISCCFIFLWRMGAFLCQHKASKIKTTIVWNSFSAVVYTPCNITHTIEKPIAALSVSSENFSLGFTWKSTIDCVLLPFAQNGTSYSAVILYKVKWRHCYCTPCSVCKREKFDQFNISLNYVCKHPAQYDIVSMAKRFHIGFYAKCKKCDEMYMCCICRLDEEAFWATSWQKQQNDFCAQRRLRSAWASAQSDQSLRCALNG